MSATSEHSREALMQEEEGRACLFCRVGEYRKAALLALKLARVRNGPIHDVDLVLPTALGKCGHYRASIIISLTLLNRSLSFHGDLVILIANALKHLTILPSDITSALDFISEVSLNPAEVAVIAAGLEDVKLRSLLVDEARSRYHFSNSELTYISAYISYREGDFSKAMSLLQAQVNQADQDSPLSSKLAARILLEHGYYYAARRYACNLLKSDRKDIEALDILGQALNAESNWKAARKSYELLHEITGDVISKLNMLFILPQVAVSANELSKALDSFIDNLERFSLDEQSFGFIRSISVATSTCHTFFLAYHGDINLKWLLEAYYRLVRCVAHQVIQESFDSYSPQAKPASRSPIHGKMNSRVRIGFMSRNLYQHSNLQAHAGLIKNLNRDLFEVVLIHRHGVKTDFAHADINNHADKSIYLASDFGNACKQIADLHLDINFITDIGMNPLDGILAMVRLAPLQVTGWGIPHTTGLTEIDYYLRSSIFDDCESQSEYTERLISLEGYLGYFELDKSSFIEKSTDYFFLPPDRFLVGCLQTLHKIHPDFDLYLEEIARIDESILIIIAASESDSLNQRFIQRIKKSAPTAYNQICFVQRMAVSDYHSLNHLLDLNLDPIHYGAGITFIETAWCGPPCITLRGKTLRSSVVSRSYEYAEINDAPIANSKDEYIALFKDLMGDPARRRKLKEEIQQKCQSTIYNNLDYIQSCERFLYQLASQL
jgi:predicted O-linked N-acetylglucosamine transferase (SPINDLY family)